MSLSGSITSSSRSRNTGNCFKLTETDSYNSSDIQENIEKFEENALKHIERMIRNTVDPDYELPDKQIIGVSGGSSSSTVEQPTQEQFFDINGELDIGLRFDNNTIRFVPANASTPATEEITNFISTPIGSISTTYDGIYGVTVNYDYSTNPVMNVSISVTGVVNSPAVIDYNFPKATLTTFITNSLIANPSSSTSTVVPFAGFGPEVPPDGSSEITFLTPAIATASYSVPINVTGNVISTPPGAIERGYSFNGSGVSGLNNISFETVNMNQGVTTITILPTVNIFARLFTEDPSNPNLTGPSLDFFTDYLLRKPSSSSGGFTEITEGVNTITYIARIVYETLRKSSEYLNNNSINEDLCQEESNGESHSTKDACNLYCIDVKFD